VDLARYMRAFFCLLFTGETGPAPPPGGGLKRTAPRGAWFIGPAAGPKAAAIGPRSARSVQFCGVTPREPGEIELSAPVCCRKRARSGRHLSAIQGPRPVDVGFFKTWK